MDKWTSEMVQAASTGDRQVFQRAYERRGAELGLTTFGWIPAVWLRVRHISVAFGLLWAAGVVFHAPYLWIPSFLVFAVFGAFHWHVLRSPRLLMLEGAIVLVTLAIALVTHFLCSPWSCP